MSPRTGPFRDGPFWVRCPIPVAKTATQWREIATRCLVCTQKAPRRPEKAGKTAVKAGLEQKVSLGDRVIAPHPPSASNYARVGPRGPGPTRALPL